MQAARTSPSRRRRVCTVAIQECRWLRQTPQYVAIAAATTLAVAVTALLDAGGSAARESPYLLLEASRSPGTEYWYEAVDFLLPVLPLLAFLYGYGAVVTERERGTIGVHCSLPVTRTELFLGKAAGRIATFALALATGTALAGVIVLGRSRTIDPVSFLTAAVLTIAFGTALVSMALALSTLASARLWALVWTMTTYFLTFASGVLLLIRDSPLIAAHPFHAYASLVAAQFDTMHSAVAMTVVEGEPIVTNPSWLLAPSVAATVLLSWIVLPLLVGCGQFRREVIRP